VSDPGGGRGAGDGSHAPPGGSTGAGPSRPGATSVGATAAALSRATRLATAADVFRVEHVSKSYGPVLALRDVNLHLRQGEILGLIGDNGSGKSTLLKILSGFHLATSGRVLLDGTPVTFHNVSAARALGIEIVYQDLALINGLSIADNVFLGRERYFGPLRTLAHRRMRDEADQFLASLGIANLPQMTEDVANLSGGQRQAIALARALYSRPRILLLDEPTAAMGPRETAHILDLVRRLRDDQGVTILFVNHNYAQLLEIADRVNLLRNGRIRFDKEVADTSLEEITEVVISEVRRALAAGQFGGVRPG
jgi:simple sugar transport system ATP-binding protein